MRSRSVMPQRNAQVTNNLKKSRFVAALFVGICIGFSLCNCSPQRSSVVLTSQDEWREGDLVLRCGYGMESKVVAGRGGSAYSHVGILHYDSLSSEWQVVHAVPGESEQEYLKTEPVSHFFNRERASKGAWLRVNCSDSVASEAARYALNKAAERVQFDNDYLLQDSTRIYCTELVWLAYGHQGVDVSGGRRHAVPAVFCKEGEGIFPSDIEKSETTLFVKPLK